MSVSLSQLLRTAITPRRLDPTGRLHAVRPPVPPGIAGIFGSSLCMLFVGGLGVTLIAGLVADIKALLGGVSIVLAVPVLLWALRRDFARLAMVGAVSLLLAVACIETIIGDGMRDISIPCFAVVILVSALLLERGAALTFSALAVLSVGLIGLAELTGHLHTRLSYAASAGELAILVFLLAMFAVLAHMVTKALYVGWQEAALNERTYREIFNATSDSIFIHDAETGSIVDVNESACTMSGFSREELLGRNLRDMPMPLGERLDVSRLEGLVRLAREGGVVNFEWQAARKTGETMWLDVALRVAQIRGQQCVLAAMRDVTERKLTADRLRAAEGLEAVGQLAGGVAHDFNNQLTGIIANASLLRSRLRNDASAQSYIDGIMHCSERSADLTRQLLAFARKGSRREDVVDVDALVCNVVSLLERSIDKRVVLEVDLGGDSSARVLGDAGFLENALLNLGLNARDAMPRGGTLRIQTRCLTQDELPESARAQLSEPQPRYVCVTVTDTGVGIAPDDIRRIFEPFFTTKPQGHGMGLSAAYGTVQAHRGAILVHSTEHAGTTFELFLPLTDQPPPREQPALEPQTLPCLRILLAEDEYAVGHGTQLLLQDLGCHVTWCRDGREALEVFERDADAFDVLILDHSMPRMLGSEVAERVAVLRPELPMIATSGFTDGFPEAASRGQRIFLPKPFHVDQLTAALTRVVGSQDTAE